MEFGSFESRKAQKKKKKNWKLYAVKWIAWHKVDQKKRNWVFTDVTISYANLPTK